MSSLMAGTPPLLRASLQHEGRNFAPWIVVVTALSASSVLIYPWIFPDEADRALLALTVGSNPALGLIFGPAFDLATNEGFNAWRSLCLGGFATGLGAIFILVKSTRGQEDSGQAELLASGVLGRSARLLVGVSLALIGSLLAGVVASLITILCGGAWEESLLLAATFTLSGWMFTGIAAIAVQLGSDARSANTLAVGTLGALFVLRGFAYALDAPTWTVWINPLGWLTETRPASGNHWWPLGLAAVATAAALAVAFLVQARRDYGQGAIPARPGPPRGAVRSPGRLALRLNRGLLITWTLTFIILGVVFGYFATSVEDILEANSAVAQILAAGATTHGELLSAFLITIFSLIGILAAIPAIQIILKVRSEELGDRVEVLLAGAVGRRAYLLSNVVPALAASALYIVISGTLVATFATQADAVSSFGDVLGQAVLTIPATWVLVAIAVAVLGLRPAATIAAWAGVIASFALTILGPTFRLWDWVLAISPFWHVPHVAASEPQWRGLAAVSLIAVVLALLGLAGFRRRDIASAA